MSTGIFDPVFYGDSTQFDIKGQYTVTLSETETINDSISRKYNSLRAITEPPPGVGVFDSQFFGDSTQFDLAQTTITSQDVVSAIHGFVRSIVEDPITISDVLDRLIALKRTLTETVTTSDSVQKLYGAVRGLTEPFKQIFDDTFFGTSTQFDVGTQTTGVTDSVTRQTDAQRAISETETISDVIARMVAFFRVITGVTITTNDDVSRTLGADRTVSDPAITSNDSVDRVLGFVRIITEPAKSISDALDRLMNTSVSLVETITSSDVITRLRSSFRAISAVAIILLDSVTREREQNRVLSEAAITVSDVITTAKSRLRSATVYLTKRATQGYLSIRSSTSYLTKRDNSDGDFS